MDARESGVRLVVHFYTAGSGNEPVREWLMSLAKDDRRTVGEDIKTVQLGWPLGMPVVRKLEPGLWEVRSHLKDGIARVLFTTVEQVIVLLHGVVKKRQTLPKSDLDLARRRMKEVRNG
ncbi:MAG TPA: type II toxin-antitoxin system RelE/ParE family toxin [bacterium]|nr:type II toxin-antitoxin system RelE/ParE family toxin [bacterium]